MGQPAGARARDWPPAFWLCKNQVGENMIRLLHLSDAHLGASYSAFRVLADLRRQEVLEAFRALPQAAETERVHAVVVAGDLFDSPRPSDYTISVVRQVFRKLVDAGRHVFVVPGHYDGVPYNPALYREPLGGAVVFHHPTFGDPVSVDTAGGPLHVYGFAYDPDVPDPLASYRRLDEPGTHVALVHGALPDSPQWRSSPDTLRLPLEWLTSVEADYLALGGSHAFRPPEASRACSSGMFAAVDLTETGPCGYVIAEIEPGAPPQVTHRTSRVLHVVDVGRFDVAGYADEAALAHGIADLIEGPAIPVVQLVGHVSFPLDAGRVMSALEERYACASVEDASWYLDAPRLDEIAGQDTVAGHLVRLARQRVDEKDDEAGRLVTDRAFRLALRALRVDL